MRKLLFILIAVLSISAARAQSYSFTQTNDGSLTVLPVVFMSLTTTGGIPNFDTESEYNNGVTNTSYASIWVKANLPWIISVKAQTANFSPHTRGAASNMA